MAGGINAAQKCGGIALRLLGSTRSCFRGAGQCDVVVCFLLKKKKDEQFF